MHSWHIWHGLRPKIVKVSRTQGVKLAKPQGLKVSEPQGLKVSRRWQIVILKVICQLLLPFKLWKYQINKEEEAEEKDRGLETEKIDSWQKICFSFSPGTIFVLVFLLAKYSQQERNLFESDQPVREGILSLKSWRKRKSNTEANWTRMGGEITPLQFYTISNFSMCLDYKGTYMFYHVFQQSRFQYGKSI